MENDALFWVLPASLPGFRWLLAAVSLLFILCKVAAVTVVGLIGAVVSAVVV